MVFQIFQFLIISIIVYFTIILVLLLWPAPRKEAKGSKTLKDFRSFFPSARTVQPSDDRFFSARDGAKRLYRLYGNGDNLLIFFHGSAGETRYLATFASSLAEQHNVTVATLDMRGHGPFPVRRGDVDYVEQQDHDIADLFAHLSKNKVYKRFYVGGHSSGGGMALRYASRDEGPRPDGLLMVTPFIDRRSPAARRDSGGWAVPNIPRFAAIEMLHRFGIRYFDKLKVLRFNVPEEARDGKETTDYSWRLYKSMTLNDDWKADIAKVVCPILIITADKDTIFKAEGYKEIFSDKQAVIEILKDKNHFESIMCKETPDLSSKWLKELGVLT